MDVATRRLSCVLLPKKRGVEETGETFCGKDGLAGTESKNWSRAVVGSMCASTGRVMK